MDIGGRHHQLHIREAMIRYLTRLLCLSLLCICISSCGPSADQVNAAIEAQGRLDFPAVLLYARDCKCHEEWHDNSMGSMARLRRMDGSTFVIFHAEAAAIANSYQPGDTIQ